MQEKWATKSLDGMTASEKGIPRSKRQMLVETGRAPNMFACKHAHLPTGLSPILRSQSLNASAIASCKLIPCLRAVMCMANDISGLK